MMVIVILDIVYLKMMVVIISNKKIIDEMGKLILEFVFIVFGIFFIGLILVDGDDEIIIDVFFLVYSIDGIILRMVINILYIVVVDGEDVLIIIFFFLGYSIDIIIMMIILIIFEIIYVLMKVLID